MDDIKFLATHFANRGVENIQAALKSMNGIVETQVIKSLRVQLSVAVAVTVQFASRIMVVLTVTVALTAGILTLGVSV